jgi:hypothetical protein
LARYCWRPSETVLFSVRPWVRSSGTCEPAAPGIRLRAFQKSESWLSSFAWALKFSARQAGLLRLLTL